jgi:alkanesulfonate monooxygenase SsuD/methylene tetrahydromethanopterin reductase-like flavin-dependent oxidoreductase (luciferase family)
MTGHVQADPAKPAGVALSGDHLAALLGDRALTARLDGAGLAFAVAGIDRVDGSVPGSGPGSAGRTVESTIAIAVLAARARRVGWLAAAAVHRDHPYNLARRIASADHLANGRSGLVLGLSDGYAPAGRDGHEVWGGAGLTEGAPVGLTTTLDAASAIRELWQSWPRESIVADRRARIYARGDQIVAIDHRGIFHIDGPLTVPTTPQGSPVLAWRARTGQEAAVARDIADVVIWPAGQDDGPGAASASAVAPGGARLFLEVPAGGGDLGARLRDHLADDRVAGVILRPVGDEPTLREFIAGTVPDLIAAGTIRAATGRGTLRERLSLPAAEPLPFAGRPAFPAPVPQHVSG